VFWWLPDSAYGKVGTPLVRTLLLATTAAISAIPVIAKVLHDMEILKSDFGLTTLSAFIVNDVLGWVIFGALLALAVSGGSGVEAGTMLHSLFEIVLFSALCMVLGSRVVGVVVRKMENSSLPYPATTLTFIFCLGLLCGAITEWIGVHAILGFFTGRDYDRQYGGDFRPYAEYYFADGTRGFCADFFRYYRIAH